jgi:hypothetical protein
MTRAAKACLAELRLLRRDAARVATSALLLVGLSAYAQPPLALVPVDAARDGGVKVAGAIEVSGGHAVIGSSGSVTAGDRTASVSLPGKGELRVCATTTVHLSRDRSVSPAPAASTAAQVGSVPGPAPVASQAQPQTPGALMIALDRGALEASFATGKFSDVLMTPDFRILISGPGQADVRVRVSPQGDTCVENRGDHAPYVTVSSQLEDGVYRVQPNQRVLFERGSLREVVDHESEPCGCPAPPVSIATGPGGTAKAAPFPLAESEGLAPVPPPTAQMGVAAGETQTQVTVPLAYNGAAPPPPAVKANGESDAGSTASGTDSAHAPSRPAKPDAALSNEVDSGGAPAAAQTANSTPPAPAISSGPGASGPVVQAPVEQKPSSPSNGIFHRIGRFFSRLFGK